MRTTIRIDDVLLRELKKRAAAEKVSLGEVVNRVLRHGLTAPATRKSPYREKTHAMGKPLINLDKALSLAFALDDEELLRKMSARR
jgi:hypothetical protein